LISASKRRRLSQSAKNIKKPSASERQSLLGSSTIQMTSTSDSRPQSSLQLLSLDGTRKESDSTLTNVSTSTAMYTDMDGAKFSDFAEPLPVAECELTTPSSRAKVKLASDNRALPGTKMIKNMINSSERSNHLSRYVFSQLWESAKASLTSTEFSSTDQDGSFDPADKCNRIGSACRKLEMSKGDSEDITGNLNESEPIHNQAPMVEASNCNVINNNDALCGASEYYKCAASHAQILFAKKFEDNR
jgi:hypothetical protein